MAGACLCLAASQAVGDNTGDIRVADAELAMTLTEAVTLALRENPSLVNARLRRELDAYDLKEAEEWFLPQLSLGTLRAERYRNAATGERRTDLAAGPGIDLRLPTGGSVAVVPGWAATVMEDGGVWNEGANVTIALSQPLLRGGGFNAGLAPVRLARLSEAGNVLLFKATVMDVVRAVIQAYRAVIEAELEVDINERSLARAQETLAVNELLVRAGRMARQDVTLTRSNIADQELRVVESQIRLDDVRRDLNVLLDLGGGVRVTPTEPLAVAPTGIDLKRSREIARANHIQYLQAMLNVRRADIHLMLARNQSRWDLSLNASASYDGDGDKAGAAIRDLTTEDGAYRVGLSLSIPIGGTESRRLGRQRLRAEIDSRQAENSLASVEREMDISVRNAVRAVNTGVRRMDLAQSALRLAEQKLEIEKGKLQMGLSSNFRLTEYQTDLVNAQVAEVRAKIAYLNAVTTHDRTLGVLLETWGIRITRLSGDGPLNEIIPPETDPTAPTSGSSAAKP